MKYVEVGGVRVSAIGLGTWQFGSTEWGYGRDYARTEAIKILHRSLDLGVTLIDTAEAYGLGRSERIVGEAIRGRRDSVFVATKIFPIGLPFMVAWRARGSARRLGVDHIDLYQQHWPNRMFPPGSTMPRMRKLVADGLIRHVGVSNHSLAQWQAAESALGGSVLSNQVRFSLTSREPQADLLPWAQREGRIVIAYSPLAQGFLSGRYDAEHLPGGSARRTNLLFLPENMTRASELVDTLRSIAKQHDATPSQVALAWLIRQPNVVAIPGASSVAQLETNVAAAELELSDDEARMLVDAADRFEAVNGPAALPALARRVIGR
jgi:aryl-alcohol dehydrogenase-like predicted oxidoreductase